MKTKLTSLHPCTCSEMKRRSFDGLKHFVYFKGSLDMFPVLLFSNASKVENSIVAHLFISVGF